MEIYEDAASKPFGYLLIDIAKTSIDKNKKDYSEIKWFATNFHYLS
jgi:hypothetical protein